ncbi:dihydrolipoyl dehydrogenase family protein [Propionibacteriaceae bacterium Y1700]|uniref:dihydrolipoyl dehydrogenase family protein n=1 Tax=Microlunatus sp. Y1700 TaxID=3418487 RepID=UPI003DA76B50
MSDTYDVIVIGAGPAGEVAAQRVREGGLTAVIVERRLVGGECSYYACIPTKAVLRPIHAVRAAQRLQGVTGAELDVSEVLARRETWVSGRDDSGQAEWLDSAEIDLVRGEARLTGEREVRVDDRVLTARQAVIVATGTRAAIPGISGLAEAAPWTNVEATSVHTLPSRLVVLGGGVVACEFAQIFAALGSAVIMVERGDRLLGRLDEIASEAVLEALRADGVDVRLGVQATSVGRTDGLVTVGLDDDTTITGDELLCALGRTPNSDDLGLDELDVDLADPPEWLHAVGDASGRVALTHMGKYQARAIGDLIVARANGAVDAADEERYGRFSDAAIDTATPQVVFTDPEVASVGPTFAEAKESGRNVRAVEVPMTAASGAALQADDYTGTARLLVDTDTELIIGATFIGQDAAELVHAATVAIVGEVPLPRLWHAVPSFPTMSEIWLRLLEEYGL